MSRYASLGPVPQPACWRVLRVCNWPQAQPSQQLATQPQPIHPARPAEVPGATNSVVRLLSSQQATHPWLRSLVAETSFRPSPTSNPPKPTPPKPTLFETRRPQPIWRRDWASPAWAQRPGLSDVSETGLRPSLPSPP